MNRIFKLLVVIIVTVAGTTGCSAQKKMFGDAAAIDGVTSVYISKAMCRMGMGLVNVDEVKDAIKQLDGLEVLNCENKGSVKKVREICSRILEASGADLLLSTEEKNEKSWIYGTLNDEGTELTTLYVVHDGDDEYTVVYLAGRFDLARIMERTNSGGAGHTD